MIDEIRCGSVIARYSVGAGGNIDAGIWRIECADCGAGGYKRGWTDADVKGWLRAHSRECESIARFTGRPEPPKPTEHCFTPCYHIWRMDGTMAERLTGCHADRDGLYRVRDAWAKQCPADLYLVLTAGG